MELQHAHGTLTVEGDAVRNHVVGKNPLTRKEWERDERVAAADLAYVLVRSPDRVTYRLDATNSVGLNHLHIEGLTSKPELDTFMSELLAANPDVVIALAHPSYGLLDPVQAAWARAAQEAVNFNAAEENRREKALGTRPEIKVKVYDTHKDYAKDAPKMGRAGWMPDSQVSDRGKASLVGTAGKVLFTGGLGLITGLSRKNSKLTVTWVKQPKGFVPHEFVDVPEVPEARTFEHEWYFGARVVRQVQPGQEFDAVADGTVQSVEPASLPALQEPQSAAEPPSPSRDALGPADKLRQLAALREEGLITDAEFEAKKADLLRDF